MSPYEDGIITVHTLPREKFQLKELSHFPKATVHQVVYHLYKRGMSGE